MIFAPLIQAASSLPTDPSALESSISALERAISALEREIATLDSSSAPLEHWIWFFTFLVAVGVAMEVWVIEHEWRDDMEAWALAHFGVLRSPGRPSITKWRVEIGSVLLITIGVMGELVIGIEIASINGQLRGKSAELRSKNAQLRTVSDQLIALINERAGKAEERAAELLKEIQPRRLSVEQEKNISNFLTSYAGKTVSVASYSLDAESMILAIQIEKALLKAHVLVWDRVGTFGAVGTPLYLGVTVDTNSSDKKLAAALFKALKTKGGLMPTMDAVAFGQGSTMWLPARPKGSTKEDAFVFVGEKPIANAVPTEEKPSSKTNAKP